MKTKLLLTSLLFGSLLLSGCGSTNKEPEVPNKPDEGETEKPETDKPVEPVEKISVANFSFLMPESHYSINQYSEGHEEEFKNTFLANNIADLTKPLTLDSVMGGGNRVDAEYTKYIKVGSGKKLGNLEFKFDTTKVKQVKEVEVEVYPYLISYKDYQTNEMVNKIEHAKVGLTEATLKEIPETYDPNTGVVGSATIKFDEHDCAELTDGMSLVTGFVDSDKGGARIYLKNIKVSYVEM